MLGLTVMMRLKLVVRFMIETNTIFNDKVHDEKRNEHDARTDTNGDDITKGYNEQEWERDDAITETDSDITRGYRGNNEKLWEI